MATYPTQDHRAQICYRDTEVSIGNSGASTVVSGVGGMRYNGTGFQLLDSVGQYDPRTVYLLTHQSLNDLIHIMNGNGPVLNGAYKSVVYVGGSFLSSETWWTTSAMTIPISKHAFSYPSGTYALPTTETWTSYTAAGAVLHTVTDSISYTGVVETSRSRSYS